MIDFTEIAEGGEEWESFSRDFLIEAGFAITTPPNRGADAGKDILVTEQLSGKLNSYPFRWLVSCKHYAHSNRSVSESDEPNIIERLQSFKANGFLGVYSTLPSSGLGSRLQQLVESDSIEDYKIFDAKLVENYLVRLGYSKLLMRYFPQSYKAVKPLHLVYNEYLPLTCDKCGKDLLQELNQRQYDAVIAFAHRFDEKAVVPSYIEDIYWACKDDCDTTLESRVRDQYGCPTLWDDLSDMIIPVIFMQWILTTMDEIRNGRTAYSDRAHKKLTYFIQAMSQKVLREMTEKERERAKSLFDLPF